MKKILVILVIILAAVFIYINFSNNKNKSATVLNERLNKPRNSKETVDTEENNPPEIPDIYDFSALTIDSKLKPVKLKLPDSLVWDNSQINVSAVIPRSVRLCDLFLVVNNIKRDMFYQAKGGKYIFKNVSLNAGRNELEVFYRIHKKRSKSATSIIIRE